MGVPNSKLSQKNINVTLIQIHLDPYSKIILSFNLNGDEVFFRILFLNYCIVVDERVPCVLIVPAVFKFGMLFFSHLMIFVYDLCAIALYRFLLSVLIKVTSVTQDMCARVLGTVVYKNKYEHL